MPTKPEDRIRELESEVQELRETLQALAARINEERPPLRATALPEEESETGHDLIGDVRERVQRVLRGDSEESIEAHIGTVWLSRLATFVTMTAVAVGARATFFADALLGFPIGPLEKTAFGYLISLAFTAYGIFARRRGSGSEESGYGGLFAEAVLGCGLAGLYFVTYAAFFIEEMRVVQASLWGLAPIFACLLGLAVVCHWQKSQTVAGITFLLAYYTVLVSAAQAATIESLLYALLTCAGLAAATVLFHFAHPWTFLSWAALVASHSTYIWFFVLNNPLEDYSGALDVYGLPPEKLFFWLSNGFLYICFLSISFACIINAWKTDEFRRGVAPMSGVNSAIFFCLTWFSIREHYLEQEWIFRLGIAATLLLFAVLASWAGQPRNYLYQIFIAKAIIMVTLALQAYLSGEKLLVAMALEALGLGLSYQRSGIVIFKVLGLALSGIAFFGALLSVRVSGDLIIGPYAIPVNWFSVVGVSIVFCLIAWFYEHFPLRLSKEARKYKAQWFLADSLLDVHPASFGIIHASGASLLLLTITILDLGDQPHLPYVLMAEGLVLAILGVLSRTPQLDVASVLLLVAAHVCFHVFLFMPLDGFETQTGFALWTTALALFTYMGAFAWERYLRRIRARLTVENDRRKVDAVAEFEHHFICSLPYLAATFLLTTLLSRVLLPEHVPAAQAGLGALLLLCGYLLRLNGIKGSGVLAALIASGTLYVSLQSPHTQVHGSPYFLLFLAAYLAALVISERVFRFFEGRDRSGQRITETLRTGFAVVMGVMGTLGLYHWSATPLLALGLLGLGIALMSLGVAFRESRYRWTALAVMSAAVLAAFLRIDINDPLSFLSFAAAASVLLGTSWAYSRRSRHAHAAPPPDDEAQDEPPNAREKHGRT